MISVSAVQTWPLSVRATEGALVGVDFGHEVVDDLGADMLRLLEHLFHQPRTLDRIGKARIVFDIGGDHQLAALFKAGDQNRLQHGARGIDRGRVAGGAGTDDEHLGVAGRHVVSPFDLSASEASASTGKAGDFTIRRPIYDCRMHLFKGSLALPTRANLLCVRFGYARETFLRISSLYIEAAGGELKKGNKRASG